MITFLRRLISRWRMKRALVRIDVYEPRVEPMCKKDLAQYYKDQETWCEYCGTSGRCQVCGSMHYPIS